MLSERNPETSCCAGAPALVRPWEPHPLCRQCVLRQRIGTHAIEPVLKRVGGTFECDNREVAE